MCPICYNTGLSKEMYLIPPRFTTTYIIPTQIKWVIEPCICDFGKLQLK